ncbi:MAG: NAD(P)/FAD-dependent oxidoreductase [Nitrospirota bacterium]
MSDNTIEIVGAGPAGLVAAITLRRAGYAVTVYEERRDVGLRFHGDFQGIENWSLDEDALDQLRRMGLTVNFRCAPFYRGTIFGPDRQRTELRSDRPLFYLVRRGVVNDSLDQGLKAQALALGVEIVFDRRMEKMEERAIIATGPKGADAIVKGVTFETDLPDQALAIMDDRLAPGGYAYLLVHQGLATMATVLFREYNREKEYFERTQAAFRALVRLDVRNPREFGGYGNFFLRSTEQHNRRLYAGESAGFQDILWGFGMRYAMPSGYLAAQSVLHGADYDRLWREDLLPRLRAALVNRLLVDRLGHIAYRYLLWRARRAEDVRGFAKRLYGPSFWKRLLLPFASRHYHSRVKDERCGHAENCDCVWCRCQRAEPR